jgi:hypothetical protein
VREQCGEDYARYRQSVDVLRQLDAPGHQFFETSWQETREGPLSVSAEGVEDTSWWESFAEVAVAELIGEAAAHHGEPPSAAAGGGHSGGAEGEIAALQDRVRKLERQVAELLGRGPADEDQAAPDPHFAWIESHREELRAHPNEFVALDPERGIVFHSTDSETFATWIDDLAPEERERLMAFNTSMFV